MHPVLRLYEDVLSNADKVRFRLPPAARFIFVVWGSATIGDQVLSEGEAWQGETAVSVKPGEAGVTCWRWELARGDQGSITANALMRGDSVAFPPGGCAYLHRHQGPGIRCLIEGGIRIDTHSRSTSFGPGGAWYESGADEVFAQAAPDKPSRFVRVMILPRELHGKSSIQYVNEEDKAKTKSQQYKIYADAPITFAARK